MPVVVTSNGVGSKAYKSQSTSPTLLSKFIESHNELESYKYVMLSLHFALVSCYVYRNGKAVKVDGRTLSIAAVAAAARYSAEVKLDDTPTARARLAKSRKVITDKVESGTSVYGLSTGFGGSGELSIPSCSSSSNLRCYNIADTRTDQPLLLGHALLQHQHIGVTPSSTQPLDVLPLSDPNSSTTMPESWVRYVFACLNIFSVENISVGVQCLYE